MGYVREPKTYRLKFADPEMEGLEVRARSLPLGQFMELMTLASSMGDGALSNKDAEQVNTIFRIFSSALVSWNLELPDPRGEDYEPIPVPADMDGLYSQDLNFIMQIVRAWMTAIASVDDELGKGLNSSNKSLEASLPMETLSPNQSS